MALTAGEGVGLAGGEVAEADEVEQGFHVFDDVVFRHALAAETEGDVVGDGHVGEQRVGLERRVDGAAVRRKVGDVLAAEQDAAGGGFDEAAEGAQEGGLAGAGAAEEDEKFAAGDLEVQVGERVYRAVADGDALDREVSQRGWGQEPALKRVHIRVRARSAAGVGALAVKAWDSMADVGKTLVLLFTSGATVVMLAGTALG